MAESPIAASAEGVEPLLTFPDLPRPQTPDEAAALAPGSEFLDPKGNKRVVPYRPKTLDEADALPEGVDFIDPQGVLRTKPKFEGLDFTAQTLYNMSVNDTEREKVLNRSYPGKVKRNERTGSLYVDDDGTLRRSKGFTEFAWSVHCGAGGACARQYGGRSWRRGARYRCCAGRRNIRRRGSRRRGRQRGGSRIQRRHHGAGRCLRSQWRSGSR